MRYRDRCAVRIYSPVAGFGSASEGSLPRLDWSGRGCFLLKINSARENSATNMRQHFRICCGRAGRLPLSAPSLRGSDESYAGGSRANCGATPPGSAGRRYRPTMRAFRANCEKSTKEATTKNSQPKLKKPGRKSIGKIDASAAKIADSHYASGSCGCSLVSPTQFGRALSTTQAMAQFHQWSF